MTQPGKAIGSGVAGAAVVTLIHEALRQFVPQAPRMEGMGMQALEKMLTKAGQPAPKNEKVLYGQALAGDLLSNSAYYSMAGIGKKPWLIGLLAGLGAGIAAVTLPKHLGLDEENANKTPQTTAMTIALYTIGGIAAAGVASILGEDEETSLIAEQEKNEMKNEKSQRSWNLKD